MKMKIGIDIDGVISDFVTSFRQLIKKEYDVDFGYDDIHQHDLYKVLGIPETEAKKLIVKTFEYDLGFQPGAIDGINKLYTKHEIILVTARPIETKQKTLEWLRKNNISYHDIVFTREGEKHHVEELCFDAIIDDHLEEITNWIGKVPQVLVFNHPWNKSLNIKNRFERIYGWENILERFYK